MREKRDVGYVFKNMSEVKTYILKQFSFLRSKKHWILCGVILLVLLLTVCFCITRCVSAGKDYEDFLDDLGARESSDRYDVKNRFGYLGRYQMGEIALKDAGFLDSDGEWTALANSYGICSESDFLQSPEGQEAAIRAYHAKLCHYIRTYGLDAYVGASYCGVEVTESGLLAACHLVGAKSMKAALQNDEMVYDGNQTPASEYMERFAGYDISEVWGT